MRCLLKGGWWWVHMLCLPYRRIHSAINNQPPYKLQQRHGYSIYKTRDNIDKKESEVGKDHCIKMQWQRNHSIFHLQCTGANTKMCTDSQKEVTQKTGYRGRFKSSSLTIPPGVRMRVVRCSSSLTPATTTRTIIHNESQSGRWLRRTS